jgi:hypothetical protein
MRLKKLGNWIQYTGGMGKTFYFNETTYEFQWERPEELGDEEEGGGGGGGTLTDNSPEKQKTPQKANTPPPKDKAKGGGEKKRAKDRAEKQIAKILQEWTTYRDPNTGMAFWYNKQSGESLWEPPPGLSELERKLDKMAAEMAEDGEDDGDAVVVDGDDDLGI